MAKQDGILCGETREGRSCDQKGNRMSECDICDRLPLGMSGFSDIRKTNMIYVDKTELIAKIARQRVPFFFSRPRRFGKSLLLSTFKNLFSKGLKDFQGFHQVQLELESLIIKLCILIFQVWLNPIHKILRKILSK